jgi:hypothetical protein
VSKLVWDLRMARLTWSARAQCAGARYVLLALDATRRLGALQGSAR